MRKTTALILISVVLLGTAIRLVPVETGERIWDEAVYLQHADLIRDASGNEFNELAFRPPLLSLIVAPAIALGGAPAAQLLVGLLSGLAIFVTYVLGDDLFDQRTGLLASLAVATSPVAIRYSHSILTDPFLPLLWAGTAVLLYRGVRDDKRSYLIASGLTAGLAVLTKFTSLLLPSICIGYLVYRNKEEIKNGVEKSALFAGSSLFTIAPYLLWYGLQYDNPFGWVYHALRLSGATDPALTYLTGAPLLILPVFLVGLFFFDYSDSKAALPLMITGAMIFMMQFAIGNKELRFLLPALPFVAIVCGNGIKQVTGDKTPQMTVLFALAVLPGLIFLPSLSQTMLPLQNGDLTRETRTSMTPTVAWFREQGNELPIYTNRDWPQLAYRTSNPVTVLDYGTSFSEHINATMNTDGFFYYTKNRPSHLGPSKQFLDNHPQFSLEASFNQSAYIYRYTINRS